MSCADNVRITTREQNAAAQRAELIQAGAIKMTTIGKIFGVGSTSVARALKKYSDED